MFIKLTLSLLAASTLFVPPGYPVADHSQPSHYTQPTLRRFERRQEDNDRRTAYERYCRELDVAWKEYRDAGSTPAAFKAYQTKALEVKRQYVYDDPYLAPVVN